MHVRRIIENKQNPRSHQTTSSCFNCLYEMKIISTLFTMPHSNYSGNFDATEFQEIGVNRLSKTVIKILSRQLDQMYPTFLENLFTTKSLK